MSHNVPAIWLGTVKNSFVPAFIGTKSGRNCQTSSSKTIVPVPRMVGSKRRHTLLRGASLLGRGGGNNEIVGLDFGHG